MACYYDRGERCRCGHYQDEHLYVTTVGPDGKLRRGLSCHGGTGDGWGCGCSEFSPQPLSSQAGWILLLIAVAAVCLYYVVTTAR
jgi:hypothetical protein